MKIFNLAIIGIGWWGKVIIDRLSNSNHINISYLVDPNPDDEAIKLAETKNLHVFKDFNHAIKNNKTDGIILCTPNTLHMNQTIKAANLGLHVYCEKPLSLKSQEVIQMIKVCKKNKTSFHSTLDFLLHNPNETLILCYQKNLRISK